MKKLLVILPLLFFVVFPKQSLAEEEMASPTPAATVAAVLNDYTLPYPGILPDNPLYAIKTIRDRIVTIFISDPLKKSSFYLLQSDKRLEASWYLLKENPRQDALALTTLSKSTTYFSQSVDELHKAEGVGEDVHAQVDSLKNAVAKHLAVASDMVKIPGLKERSGFEKEVARLETMKNTVVGFSTK